MQRTTTKENQESNDEDIDTTTSRERTVRHSGSSWSDLMSRYKNIWRGRIRDKDSKAGVSAVFATVLISAVLSTILSIGSVSATVTAVPSAVVLGTMGGVIVSSNAYDLDGFINAHIGMTLGLLLGIYQVVILTLGGSPALEVGATAVVSFLYMMLLSVAMVGYGIIGGWIRSIKDSWDAGA